MTHIDWINWLLDQAKTRLIVRLWLTEQNAGPGGEEVQLQVLARNGDGAVGCVKMQTTETLFGRTPIATPLPLGVWTSSNPSHMLCAVEDWTRYWLPIWTDRKDIICVMEPKKGPFDLTPSTSIIVTQHLARLAGMIGENRPFRSGQDVKTPLLDTIHSRLSQLIISNNRKRLSAAEKYF